MKLLCVSDDRVNMASSIPFTKESWIEFPRNISNEGHEVTILANIQQWPRGKPIPETEYRIQGANLTFEHLENYGSFIEYYKLWPFRYFMWRRKIDKLIKLHDLVLVFAPTPTLPLISSAASRNKKPLVLLVAGNVLSAPDKLTHGSLLWRFLYRGLSKLVGYQESRAASSASAVYVFGPELFSRFKGTNSNLRLIRIMQIGNGDFVFRDDTCAGQCISILRIGWLQPIKGIEYLLEAVKILRERNCFVHLELVGSERELGYENDLRRLSKSLDIEEQVKFTGWIPFDKTKDVYMRNDIQVISSLSEGVPRVILEGAARGLPLVTTTAGGSGQDLVDAENALLVPPSDPYGIADAVERIILDICLRRKLIKGGYSLAREHSFENAGRKFISELESLI